MPSFYNGKRFFLTYARCDAEPTALKLFLEARASCRYVLVAREKHEDGALHLHACVEFCDVQRHAVGWLDYEGKHPNKQDPRKWDACKTYVKKDGDFVETEKGLDARGDYLGLDLSLQCAGFNSEEEWYDFCIREKIGFNYARWFWQRMHADDCSIVADVHEGVVCNALKEFRYDWSKTLVLKGPSGCGKTTWAKTNIPKPALFVSHVDELKSFRPGYHVSIIFDDVDFSHWPRTSQISVVDRENPRSVHCRHSVARIPAGINKVFTCNEVPLSVQDEAIRRRIRIVNVNE